MRTIILTTRTIIFIIVYLFVLGFPFLVAVVLQSRLVNIFGLYWWKAPLSLMAMTATMGPFLYVYFVRRAEDKILADEKRYLNILKQVSVALTRVRDTDKLLNLIVHIITKIVKVQYTGIYLFNQKTNEYILQVSRGANILRSNIRFDSNIVAWSKLKREPIVYSNTRKQILNKENSTHERVMQEMRLISASVIIPIILEETLMGFIALSDKISKKDYLEEDIYVFQVFASQCALAIENAQFIEDKTNRDSLTELWNHKFFLDRLDRQTSEAKQMNKLFSVVFFDIDNFKHYNDTYGHHVGDMILYSVAKIIRENLKKEDVVARYGGEEFSIILNELNKDSAFKAAERIRKAVESNKFIFDEQKKNLQVGVTISGGIAAFPEDASGNEGIIELADTMLYQAKRSGRNKICFK